MQQETPEEAALKYPEILGEAISDVLVPKSKEEIADEAKRRLADADEGEIEKLHQQGILSSLPEEDLKKIASELVKDLKDRTWIYPKTEEKLLKRKSFLGTYLPKEEFEDFVISRRWKEMTRWFSELKDKPAPSTVKELNKIEKEQRLKNNQKYVQQQIDLIKGRRKNQSIYEALRTRALAGQFHFVEALWNLYMSHPRSYHSYDYNKLIYSLLDGENQELERSSFSQSSSRDQWGISFVNSLIRRGMLEHFKRGNKQLLKLSPDWKKQGYDENTFDRILNSIHNQMEKYDLTE
jgi:hypothetical protein